MYSCLSRRGPRGVQKGFLMYKRTLFLAAFLWVTLLPVFAGGRQDNESREAKTPEGFTETIDIGNKATGKWNIYLEAQDKGGNTIIAGPHNIFIDPESDLPITRIINPRPNMRVQGNLNIVGTATDDDGIRYVELIVTRGADGKGEIMQQTRAQGTEFWSYFLDTSDTMKWRDGVYTVTAWSVDINGLSGISEDFPVKSRKIHQISWNLDRKNPEIAITSHSLGALVNGKVNLSGTVWDGNGIYSLSYSLDDGERYQPINLKYDTKNDIYNYDFTIDSRNLEDGPAVILLRARDRMGSIGAHSFLINVNNAGPDVQIIYPGPDEAVNGIFTVAGYAMHKVGLASLSWKLGKESGDIELKIGNHWWAKEFDIRGQDLKSIDLEIRAVDRSGNVTVATRRLQVDQEANLPKVTLIEPVAGKVIPAEGMSLIGTVSDNDGVQSLLYSINGSAPVEIPCSSGVFQFTINDIPEGTLNLEVWAKDITNVEGRKVSVRGIISPGAVPQPKITNVVSSTDRNAAPVEFYSGIEVNSEPGSNLILSISPFSNLQSYSYQLGSKLPVVVNSRGARSGDFSIPIPPDVDFGLVKLEIKTKDIYDRESVLEDYIYITDLSSRRVIDNRAAANQLSSGTLRLVGLNNETSWPSQIVVPRGGRTPIPLSAAVDAALGQGARVTVTVKSVTIGQERPPINASVGREGQILVNLPADLPADLTEVKINAVYRTGESYEVSGEFWLLRPRVDGQQANTYESFTWVRPDNSLGDGRILLSTSINDVLVGIYNGRPLRGVEITGSNIDYLDAFLDNNGRVNLLGAVDGAYGPLRFELTDKDGKKFTTPEYRFLVDASEPMLEMLENLDYKWVQNTVEGKFMIHEDNKIKSVDFSQDLGATWQPLLSAADIARLGPDPVVEFSRNIASLEDGTII